jgi:hypothetical protein
MFAIDNTGLGLDTIAHIIQVALTPVFLLTGIATLLNVFSTRLARVSDRVHRVREELDVANDDQVKRLTRQLAHLRRRSIALDVAVVLGALGGAATCGAVLTMFLGALREATIASMLFGLFGFAVFCALVGICAFTVEMLMASTGLRSDATESQRAAAQGDARPQNRRRQSTPDALPRGGSTAP